MRFFRGENVVVRLGLLQHHPHAFDIFGRVAPVALGFEIAEIELVLQAVANPRDSARDFAADENFAAPRGFVVEEDPVHGEQAVAVARVCGHPVAVELGAAVRAPRAEWSQLVLRALGCLAEDFAARGVVETRRNARLANGVKQARGAERRDVARIFGNIETHAHVALRAEVINFVGREAIEQLHEARGIGKVGKVEKQPRVAVVPVGKDDRRAPC